ncbi:MAG: hypothetical protein K2X27_21360 [Candidatus Obscuribacterales bacterium]|nr:hypothetical protein [Candidatus Obscuribacterales bacterium]
MNLEEGKTKLQELLEQPRNAYEKHLAEVLNALPPEMFEQTVNLELNQINGAEACDYVLQEFERIDRYPNPQDKMLSRDEITEALRFAPSSRQKAALLFIWMNFESIKEFSTDHAEHDKIFDNSLSIDDFLLFKKHCLETLSSDLSST